MYVLCILTLLFITHTKYDIWINVRLFVVPAIALVLYEYSLFISIIIIIISIDMIENLNKTSAKKIA